MRGMSGRTGHTSCMNMLRKPRRLRMPDSVEVPTFISASLVADDNSLMCSSLAPCVAFPHRASLVAPDQYLLVMAGLVPAIPGELPGGSPGTSPGMTDALGGNVMKRVDIAAHGVPEEVASGVE